MKYKYLLLPLSSLLLICSCSRRAENSDAGEDVKLKSVPEINKVEVLTLQRTDFRRQVLSNGRLSAVRKCDLSFRQPGVVTRIHVRTGQKVKNGDVIAELDRTDRELALNAARIAFDRAQLDLFETLAGLGYPAGDTLSVPEEVLRVAKIRSGWSSARNSLMIARHSCRELALIAPISGRIANLSGKEYSSSGASFSCSIIDDSVFDVEYPVLESEYPFVKKVSEVRVQPYSSVGNKSYKGRVTAINPVVDKSSMIGVSARIGNDGMLMEGMNVKIIMEEKKPGQLVVPKSAVVVRDNLDVLFRYNDGRAEWVYVNILDSNSESYSIEANADRGATLSEGDIVIVSGNLNLADGSAVRLKQK